MQESAVSVNPSQSVIQAGKVTFIHRGLQEFELIDSAEQDSLAVTLLRSVGWLSRRDLRSRGLGAGPDLATPDAQCLGESSYQFALDLQLSSAVTALNQAQSFRKPVTLLRGHASQKTAQITLHNPELKVSSTRRVKTGIEIRVWNPTSTAITAEFSAQYISRVKLSGDVIGDNLQVKPKQIATFVIAEQEATDV